MEKLKKKVKEQINQVPPMNIVITFFIVLLCLFIKEELPQYLDEDICEFIYNVGLIVALVFSKSFRALLLVGLSIEYYIFIGLPINLVKKYNSLDNKNKKIVKAVALLFSIINRNMERFV